MTITHTLTLSRTCEARAPHEVHGLHSIGEHDLADVTCEREGDERGKEKVRNEGRTAAARINHLNKYSFREYLTITRPLTNSQPYL